MMFVPQCVVEFLDVRQMFEPVKNTLAYFGLTRNYLALAASLRQKFWASEKHASLLWTFLVLVAIKVVHT